MTVTDDAPDLDDDDELDAAAEAAADAMLQDEQDGAQDEPGTTDDADEADGSGDDPDEAQDENQGEKKPRVRERLRAAEARVAELEEALSASRWSMFHRVMSDLGLSGELMMAVGLKVEDHLDEHGDVDTEALAQAAEAKRVQLGLPSKARRPQPNPVAGLNRGGRREGQEPTSLGGILKQHVESTGLVR